MPLRFAPAFVLCPFRKPPSKNKRRQLVGQIRPWNQGPSHFAIAATGRQKEKPTFFSLYGAKGYVLSSPDAVDSPSDAVYLYAMAATLGTIESRKPRNARCIPPARCAPLLPPAARDRSGARAVSPLTRGSSPDFPPGLRRVRPASFRQTLDPALGSLGFAVLSVRVEFTPSAPQAQQLTGRNYVNDQ